MVHEQPVKMSSSFQPLAFMLLMSEYGPVATATVELKKQALLKSKGCCPLM